MFDHLSKFKFPKPIPYDDPTYVYLFQADHNNWYKIGISADIKRRLKDFATLPFDLVCIHHYLLPNRQKARDIEAALHKEFARNRVNGEWFKLDLDDVLWIQKVVTQRWVCLNHNDAAYISDWYDEDYEMSHEEQVREKTWCLENGIPYGGDL